MPICKLRSLKVSSKSSETLIPVAYRISSIALSRIPFKSSVSGWDKSKIISLESKIPGNFLPPVLIFTSAHGFSFTKPKETKNLK